MLLNDAFFEKNGLFDELNEKNNFAKNNFNTLHEIILYQYVLTGLFCRVYWLFISTIV